MQSRIEPEFLSVSEAGAFLGIGKSKINQLLAAQKIRRTKIGRRTLISLRELRDFAAKLQVSV